MSYPDPCISCTRTACLKNCGAWKKRYLYRQKQINAYARQSGIVPDAPVYEPGKNPCQGCRREETCDSICVARAKYWDDCLEKERKGIRKNDA